MRFFVDYTNSLYELTCEGCGQVLIRDSTLTDDFAQRTVNVHAQTTHGVKSSASAHFQVASDDEHPHRRIITLAVRETAHPATKTEGATDEAKEASTAADEVEGVEADPEADLDAAEEKEVEEAGGDE